MIQWWKSIRNRIDYGLRQKIHWIRPFESSDRDLPSKQVVNKPDLRVSERGKVIAQRLVSTYHLEAYQNQTSIGNFQENLFYLHMLETAFIQAAIQLPAEIKVYDIGTSHWFYAHALSAFLTWYQSPSKLRSLTVKGFDCDPFRVHADLHSRFDHAVKNIQGLPDFEFIPHGFSKQADQADLTTLFFPFVFASDHLDWGLPMKLFNPAELIWEAWQSTKPGGWMLVVNQGDTEHQQEKKILKEHKIPVKSAFCMDDVLFQYDLRRYILVCGPKAEDNNCG